jgi:hypothetical protein
VAETVSQIMREGEHILTASLRGLMKLHPWQKKVHESCSGQLSKTAISVMLFVVAFREFKAEERG